MSENYLDEMTSITNNDKNVLKNLSTIGERLKELKADMLAKEELAKEAKKKYEHFANNVLPAEMISLGISSINLESGGTLKIVRNYYCNPNKNQEDRKKIVDWLRANGGDELVAAELTTSAENKKFLQENNLAFTENTSVNTNKLKAFIKDKLGITSGVQQIEMSDIPECVHFQEVITTECEI